MVNKKKLIHARQDTKVSIEKNESDISNSASNLENIISNDALNEKQDIKEEEQEIQVPSINKIVLSPAGYPIRPLDASNITAISVSDDKLLFQTYALEQWIGINVKVGDYIFDQVLMPDFGFKVIQIEPTIGEQITTETEFSIEQGKVSTKLFNPVYFSDIIGNKQAIEKAQIILEFLKNPEKFGEWAPRNILFDGVPGTGKTLTAKAIATESKCSFLAKKGTTLIGTHVGDGAARIHQMFAQARKMAPTIIFIDELDAIGLSRSYQNVRGDVVEITTALLAEMDGLENNDGVILIAATNALDLLDIGLQNRFEEEISFELPNESEREAMLKLFYSKVNIPLEIDYPKISHKTDNWSGRALHEKLVKISVHRAIREKKDKITTKLLLSIIKQVNGSGNSSNLPSEIFS
ncbi:MAG: AAA family ATPase [Promethearchaeota archaeon]